jgi:hypothetical protein
MGTVTAIGGGWDDSPRIPYPSGTTSASSLTYISGTRASIRFDSWETAIGAAMVAARSSQNVRVNKIGVDWVVSWDAPVLINPAYPTYPQSPGWWQNPVISWGTHTVTNGESA